MLSARILNTVVPLALSTRPGIVLHAASLVNDQGSIGILGASGAGKSTLTAAWALSGRGFLSDDWIRLDLRGGAFHCEPCLDLIRVTGGTTTLLPDLADGFTTERLVGTKSWLTGGEVSARFHRSPVPLRAVVSLTRDPTAASPSLERLPSREAMMTTLHGLILWDRHEVSTWRALLPTLDLLTRTVPFYALRVPHGTAGLMETVARLGDLG